MDKKKLSIKIGSLVFFIFIVNYFATKFYWYSSIWWFDMPMHFMGGLWLGLVFVLLFGNQKFDYILILKIFFGVILIGIFWEIFEIVVNNYIARDMFNTLDTVSDIFFDLSGGAFAILYFIKKNYLNKNIKS